MAIINGDASSQTLYGTANRDTIDGKEGDDVLFGFGGNDDLIGADGNDWLYGGPGIDYMNGGPGVDWVSYNGAPSAVYAYLTFGGVQGYSTGGDGNDVFNNDIENLQGGNFNDSLWGDDGRNWLGGLGGNDQLTGRGGDDILDGDAGDDTLFGDEGNDILRGGADNDYLSGGNGIDTARYDFATGYVVVNLFAGTASGGDGNDTLISIENVVGSAFGDTLIGNDGNNTLEGGDGDDQLNGGFGTNVLIGGSGFDFADYRSYNGTLVASLASGTATLSLLGTSPSIATLIGIEGLLAGAFNDTLTGDGNANTLVGGSGNDTLFGGAGNDTLRGDDGNDVLDGGADNDRLEGGAGVDTASFAGAPGAVNANLLSGLASGDGSDTLISIENVVGSAFGDTLIGNDGDNTLNGGAGNDVLLGDAGNDVLDGGANNDSLDGGAGTDTASFASSTAGVIANLSSGTASGDGSDTLVRIENLTGSNFDDILVGNSENNVLSGGDGNDTLIGGGGGTDRLNGGDGNDVLYSGTGNDILSGGSGTDEVRYDYATSGVTVNLVPPSANAWAVASGGGGLDVLNSIEDLFGSPFNDTLTGDDGPNAIGGGAGNDTLSGGAGIDVLTGGSGDDTLDGGSESDTAVYSGSRSLYTITAVPGGHTISSIAEGVDTLSNVEFAQFSDQTIALSSITLDTTPPTAQSFSPADEASGVPVASNIVVSFSEAIQGGTGNIALRNASGTLIESFNVGSKNSRATISGNTLTIDPTSDLVAGTGYRVDFDFGSVKDLAGNSYAGTTSYNFTTVNTRSTVPTPGDDLLTGTDGADTIDALAGNDIVNALGGDDRITGGPGADVINGGSGSDTALYAGVPGDYLLSRNSQGVVTVSDRFGVMDTLTEVEFLQIGSSVIPTSTLGYLPAVTAAPEGVSDLVFRFYNVRDKAFFYTPSVAERNEIIRESTDPSYKPETGQWPFFYQGATFEQAHTSGGAMPVYRFWNYSTGHHFFTLSEAEKDYVLKESTDPSFNPESGVWPFNYEGVGFVAYADPNHPAAQPVFRFYSYELNRHFFTADVAEANEIRLTGQWNDEGIGFYGEVPG